MTHIIFGPRPDDALVDGATDEVAVVNDEPSVVDAKILALAGIVLPLPSQLNLNLTRPIRLQDHREDLLQENGCQDG